MCNPAKYFHGKETTKDFQIMSLNLHAQNNIFIFYLCTPKVLQPYESLT